MERLSSAYRLQRRLARQRIAYFRNLKILIGVSALGWGVAVYGVEFVSSATGIDLPYAFRDAEFLVALVFHLLPHVMITLTSIFYFYVVGASAGAAGNVFLLRTGVPAQLLSVTPFEFRPVVVAGFLAIYRTFLPHFIVIATVNLGLATYTAFGFQRIQYLYRVGSSFDFAIVVTPALYVPPLSAFVVAALVTTIASAGILAVISSIALAAAILFPHIRSAGGVLFLLLLCLPVVAWLRYGMSPDTLIETVRSGLSALLDGGRGLASLSLVQHVPGVDYSHHILAAFTFLIISTLFAVIMLSLSIWRLRAAHR